MAQSRNFAAECQRGQAPLRLFVAFVLAIVLRGRLGDLTVSCWLAAYVTAQAIELWALWPFRAGQAAPAAWRAGAALGGSFLVSAAFGAISLPLWRTEGEFGAAGAGLLLAGAILNVLGLSRGAPLAFVAGATPFGGYLVAGPLMGRTGGDPFSLPFLLAEALFLGSALMVYAAAERISKAGARTVQELTASAEGALADAEAKSTFIATVSHELRTPLTAILAGAGDLKTSPDPKSRDRGLMIADAARMMRRLLDDLLDLTKIEANRMTVEAIPFDLRQLAVDVTRFWAAEAARKGLVLGLSGEAELPRAAIGDPLRLRQVLNNLLSNAVKFTDTGSVSLTFKATPGAQDAFVFEVRVADTGRGLSADQLGRLFVPFEQADLSVARTHGGTGLGLSISRELARLMDGDLIAQGLSQGGAAFTFTASLGRQLAAPSAVEPERELGEAVGRILLVDDNALGRRALSLLLEPLGASVVQAASGEEALEHLAQERFDLVLMDVTMVGIGGREATRQLRARPGPNRDVPVLAVTGLTAVADVEACRAAGMDGWVAKPVDARMLYDAIGGMLSSLEGEGETGLEQTQAA